MTWLVAGVALACAVALLVPAGARLPHASRDFDPRQLIKLTPLLAVAVVLLWPGHSLLLVGIALASAWGVMFLRNKAKERAAADRARVRLVEAADALASELRAGLPPVTALGHVAGTWPELAPIATAARIDADVAGAFRRAGEQPGAEALSDVGAAWHVAQQSGSGLAAALERVVARAREDLEVNRVVTSELASARATALIIAVLPVLVLSMTGTLQPWRFLFASTPGLGCLALGLLFSFAGLWWIEQIVIRVSKEGV